MSEGEPLQLESPFTEPARRDLFRDHPQQNRLSLLAPPQPPGLVFEQRRNRDRTHAAVYEPPASLPDQGRPV